LPAQWLSAGRFIAFGFFAAKHYVATAEWNSVNPQSNQIKNNYTEENGCHDSERPHQPLGKGAIDHNAPIRFEQLFVNDFAVLIFDPSAVSLGSLLLDNLTGPIRVVSFGFDDPSGHGDLVNKKTITNTIAQSEL
jgi:hypothetical protein